MADNKKSIEKQDPVEELLEEVSEEKMVTIFVPGKNEDDVGELVITINFVEYRIPKNEEVRVPEHVATFIKNQKLDSAASRKYDKKNQLKA